MYSTNPDLPRTSLIGLFAAGFAAFGAAFFSNFLAALLVAINVPYGCGWAVSRAECTAHHGKMEPRCRKTPQRSPLSRLPTRPHMTDTEKAPRGNSATNPQPIWENPNLRLKLAAHPQIRQ